MDPQTKTQHPHEQEHTETLLEQMGGWKGLVYSTLPVFVFVPANAIWNLKVAIISSLMAALAVFVVRVVQRAKLLPAVSGFLAVALCAFIAFQMGEAKGYYLWGIWVSAAYAVLSLGSIVARWPLVGVLWNLLNGTGQHWRESVSAQRWYSVATFFWAIVFTARFVTQQWLYSLDKATILGVARILMGWPLTLVAVVGTIWAVKKAREYSAVLTAENIEGSAG